jgi:hypothetical protein
MKRNILIIAAAALLCGGVTGTARADSWSSARMSTGAFAGGTPDYSLLNNQAFDYTDLLKARNSGLSDDSIATIARIAEITGLPYGEITQEVLDGQTFGDLSWTWGFDLTQVLNNQDEKTKIANYVAAYETTGRFAAKNGTSADMAAPMMPANMNGMGSSTTMPATPSTSTTPGGSLGTTTNNTNTLNQTPSTAPANGLPVNPPATSPSMMPAPTTAPNNGTSTNGTATNGTSTNGTSTNGTAGTSSTGAGSTGAGQ